MTGRYPTWGEFLKRNRELHFRSARRFCTEVRLEISYPQYSRYEAGEQLPSLPQALQLCQFLKIPALEGILEWGRAQIPPGDPAQGEVDQLLKQLRSPRAGSLPEEPKDLAASVHGDSERARIFATTSISFDDVIVFNRSHLNLFVSDASYRDIFTYINAFAPDWIPSSEIGHALDIKMNRLDGMLQKLHDLGVIILQDGKCKASKRAFYFPDDTDFFELRNLNLRHNASSILNKLTHDDVKNRKAYRNLVTRELSASQVRLVMTKLDEVLSHIVSQPETHDAEEIYSLCVLFGKRFSRPKHLLKTSSRVVSAGATPLLTEPLPIGDEPVPDQPGVPSP